MEGIRRKAGEGRTNPKHEIQMTKMKNHNHAPGLFQIFRISLALSSSREDHDSLS
jgi:hypothetical protein